MGCVWGKFPFEQKKQSRFWHCTLRHPWGSPKALPAFLQVLEITHQRVCSFAREQSQTLAPKAQTEASQPSPDCMSLILGLSCLFGLLFLGKQPLRFTSLQWRWTNHNYGRLNKMVEVKVWNTSVLLCKAWFGKASRMFFHLESRSQKHVSFSRHTQDRCALHFMESLLLFISV